MPRQGRMLRGVMARPMGAVDTFQQIFHGQVSQDINGILPAPLVTEPTDSGLLVRVLQIFQAGLANRLGELKFFSSGGHFVLVATVYRLMLFGRERDILGSGTK